MTTSTMPNYTLNEERANTITHGFGFVLALVATIGLIVLAVERSDAWRMASAVIYGTSLILLYAASTFYHLVKKERIKKRLRLMDHSAVFLLIAGSYTPFALVLLNGPLGFFVFGLIWTIAIAGIIITVFFMDRMKNYAVLLYVAMAWIVVFIAKPLLDVLPMEGVYWLVAGGAAYMTGVAFYLMKKTPYNHAIWHVLVIAGSVMHFICILSFVLLPETA